MHKYKIIKEEEDPKASLIEKDGITAQFTMAQLEAEDLMLAKALLETSSNLKVQEGIMSNIEHHHPWVLEETDEDLNTAHMYFEAKSMVRGFNKKRIELQDLVQESRDEMAEIHSQLGFKESGTSDNPAPALEETVNEESK